MNKFSKPAPIILFAYNRPWHTAKTVESLLKNDLAIKSDLIVFSDGAKNFKDIDKVFQVRKYVNGIQGFKSLKVIEQKINIGLAASIINGVTEVINKYGKVIVIEDDVVTSPYFLSFMNDALETYITEEKVMHISGYMYPVKNNCLEDTFFLKPATCWGWATWKRAWKFFNKDPDYLIDTFDKKMIYDFNLNGSYNYFRQVKFNKIGRINTWAVFWYATIFLQGGLSLHPSHSFVTNIGHDGQGVHCPESDKFDVELNMEYPINFSKKIFEDKLAKRALIEYFIKTKSSFPSKIFKRVQKLINSYQK